MDRADALTKAGVELQAAGALLGSRADNLDGLMANIRKAAEAIRRAGEYLADGEVTSLLPDLQKDIEGHRHRH
jgi:hypothetical protein